jgi:hypothetical protein
MTPPIPPSLERFGDDLNRAAHRELSTPSGPVRARIRRPRPRLLAGGTLGLAGVSTALVLAMGGSAAAPAFAITKEGDGSVLVNINAGQDLPAANQKLTAMGIDEQVTIYMAIGPAAVSGPVTCTPAPGASSPSGPPVKILVGTDGTEVIGPGESAGNTGEGTFHLDHCVVAGDTGSGNTGNTGNASAG